MASDNDERGDNGRDYFKYRVALCQFEQGHFNLVLFMRGIAKLDEIHLGEPVPDCPRF